MELRLLRESDDRAAFSSGDEDLDRFFHRYAGQNQFRHHLGATWVAVAAGRIVGFVTLAPGQLDTDELQATLERRLPGYPLPLLRLARLAVSASDRGHGIGTALVRKACLLALEMAERFGCLGIVVDAKPDAIGFYGDLGFFPLEVTAGTLDTRPRPTAMFLPLALVERARAGGPTS
ncbi:MAG TPA: GNAT family N-acetyltransferase [Longimicrobiales bacterium]|nr:GNAT family N-acetyltransferase [Longimicrobiales bacterium]